MGRILVVEDDVELVAFLEEALGEWGHEVTTATDGQAAYQRIFLAQPAYDLLICDLVLPGMQGPDLLRRVVNQVRDRTPVVVMSGKVRALDALGDVRDWAFRVLKKPFDLDDLHKTVDQALWQRSVLQAEIANGERIRELETRVHELVRQNVDLWEDARLDPLTRLPNRRRLEEDLDKKYANADRYGSPFALALCDVDGFRRYNEEFGYEGGDRAIRHVALLLREATREGDTVYRYGGDEFVVLMEAQSTEQGVRVADRLREAVAAAVGPNGGGDQVTVSAGLAAARPGRPRSTADLIREANGHLTRAKKEGGNRVLPRSSDESGASPAAVPTGVIGNE